MKKQNTNRRSLNRLEKLGYNAHLVQTWNSFSQRWKDFLTTIDIIAFNGESILWIQACTTHDFAAHKRKVEKCGPLAQLIASGAKVEVWAWSDPSKMPDAPKVYPATLIDGALHLTTCTQESKPARKPHGDISVDLFYTPGGKQKFLIEIPSQLSVDKHRFRSRLGSIRAVRETLACRVHPDHLHRIPDEYRF